ncbi:MAG: hypothetical protein K2N63_01550 [Lachnospiraceae bacterium]|nr:hypothetical protein [Lachnospiraceae bacterium]
MFGYVTINKEELSSEDYERFHSYYCGLCRVLRDKYKRRGQLLLNYDMTFLAILLTSLYECGTRTEMIRCIPNGAKRHAVRINEMTEYAADMNIALTYHKCRDNWSDDHSHTQHMMAKMLGRGYSAIKEKYPRQISALERELSLLSGLERRQGKNLWADELNKCEDSWKKRAKDHLLTAPKEGDADIDSAANCFGRLTAEVFVYREDEWGDTLWEMGFYLGKFIYLMDAYDDLEKDRKRGSYNPLLPIARREDFEAFCRQVLVMTMADCSRKFEMLPLIEEVGILRNIIYSGVWTKYELLRAKRVEEDASGLG